MTGKTEKRAIRQEKVMNWLDRKKQKELETAEEVPGMEVVTIKPEESVQSLLGKQRRPYSLSIAIPGSILNNAQSQELRVYLAGQIARAASISCVDEIVIFDEYARLTPNQIESYYNGSWQADKPFRDDNSECIFHMARILEYLECPQYLRKTLFPLHKSLAFAGVLNPLDCPHHLRANDLSIPYRDGIILDKPVKSGRGPLCDVGLDKELQLEAEIDLPPLTRITYYLFKKKYYDIIFLCAKRYRGKLISPQRVRHRAGIYWGYNVRIAGSLSEALKGQPEYNYIIGTSEHGTPLEELSLSVEESCRILLVFGGLKGLEAAVEADEEITTSVPAKAFQHYVSIAPGQGSRTIRTEEAVLMTLGILKSRLDFPYSF
uniref:Methyltransferase C9orf114 homolog n=1 Tax=Syphacia muris TaxID=451379 RepID=A0A0N5ADZ2_9BILA